MRATSSFLGIVGKSLLLPYCIINMGLVCVPPSTTPIRARSLVSCRASSRCCRASSCEYHNLLTSLSLTLSKVRVSFISSEKDTDIFFLCFPPLVAVVVDVEEEEEEEEEGSRGSSDGRRGGISVGRVVLNVVVLLLVVPEAEAVSCVGLEAETVVVVVVVVFVDGGGEAAAVVFSTPNSFRKCDLSRSNSLPLGCCF